MSLGFQNIEFIEENFVEISHPQVLTEMRYASLNNFMGQNIYQGFDRFFLAPVAAQKFYEACSRLATEKPHYKFKIWDSLRPQSIQKLFWDFLADTPYQNYVANPYPGSLHNFGLALDLTLVDEQGVELDMGTDFDDFRPLAQPQLEEQFLKTGELSVSQIENRQLLRRIMTASGFLVLPHEWWHFNALPKEQVYNNFPLLRS